MVNGSAPRLVIVFGPDGGMQMQSSLNPMQLALAIQFIEMQVQDALRPKPGPGLLVPKSVVPPDIRGN